jgi:putative aldouronate transport system permease protein
MSKFARGAEPSLIRGRKTFLQKLVRDRAWVLMMLPPFAYYIIFHYVPMYGVLMAFEDYRIGRGVFGSEWVGLRWFLQFFRSVYFLRLLRNTFFLSFYSLVFGFPVPIIFALVVNEFRSTAYQRVVQTVSYLPHFISMVIVVGMMVNFLSPNNGIVNDVLKRLGLAPVSFMTELGWFRPLYVVSGIWQEFGFGSIIYLAAVAGINVELYDAAVVDGCTRFQKIRFVTLPGIAPTITILLIMRLGSLLSVGFEKVLLMYSPIIYEVSDVISTYVYRRGIIESSFSFATAVGLFNSVVCLVLLAVFNQLARRFSETSLW